MTKDAPADQALIEAIAKLLNEQNLAEIEIEREDLRVRVTRSYASTGVQQVMVPALVHQVADTFIHGDSRRWHQRRRGRLDRAQPVGRGNRDLTPERRRATQIHWEFGVHSAHA